MPTGAVDGQKLVESRSPECLDEEELTLLGRVGSLPTRVQQKLELLLSTPFLSNRAHRHGHRPRRSSCERLGPYLRVLFWNIAQGSKLDDILLAFRAPDAFMKRWQIAQSRPSKKRYEQAVNALECLRNVDVLVLNEADLGLRRSGYRHVVKDLAEALGMNYAFGVEFVEVDPLEQLSELLPAATPAPQGGSNPSAGEVVCGAARPICRGLHGNAILSRYPIRRADILRFQCQGYDWYAQEKQVFSFLRPHDDGERFPPPLLHALSFRQLRRGGRMALIVELDTEELPDRVVTLVATHLENRASPLVRRRQLGEILEHIHAVGHPVILAGDLNTSGRDQTRGGAMHRALLRLCASSNFWSWVGHLVLPYLGGINDFLQGAPRNWDVERDPTCRGLRSSNEERKLFDTLEKFRFLDGRSFDFRGDPERSLNQTTRTLANSNQRNGTGFAPTSESPWAWGPLGRRKLDWIFVKPYTDEPKNRQASYRFAPHFGRTLSELNAGLQLSDHHPMVVDLPFEEPRP
ncbi:MAG: endonuclease/exonuclease/phosphatase family protein [Acidobacteriota bacterium]